MRFTFSFALMAGFLATAPAIACDMVPGSEVHFTLAEKVPAWMVWKFTPQSHIDGYMLTNHMKRRDFPAPAQEKAFLEAEIGRAATALFKKKPDSIVLVAASETVPAEKSRFKTSARAFTMKLAFAGQEITAPGYMRLNPKRKDISLIVALASPADAAGVVARNTSEHPGFDCAAGDGP